MKKDHNNSESPEILDVHFNDVPIGGSNQNHSISKTMVDSSCTEMNVARNAWESQEETLSTAIIYIDTSDASFTGDNPNSVEETKIKIDHADSDGPQIIDNFETSISKRDTIPPSRKVTAIHFLLRVLGSDVTTIKCTKM